MSDVVTERYARAVFELGNETNQLKPLTEQLQRIALAYSQSAELRGVLDNPLIDDVKRAEVLQALSARIGLTALALNTVKLLARRRRLHALPDIARRLGTLADEKSGVLRVTVTSAAALPESFFDKLGREIERLHKKKAVIERRTDPSLIGGAVLRIGDQTVDATIRGRLDRFEKHAS